MLLLLLSMDWSVGASIPLISQESLTMIVLRCLLGAILIVLLTNIAIVKFVFNDVLKQDFLLPRNNSVGKRIVFQDDTYKLPSVDNVARMEARNAKNVERHVTQPDAEPLYYWEVYLNASEGSARRIDAQRKLFKVMSHRLHIHDSMQVIGKLLFGEDAPTAFERVQDDKPRNLPRYESLIQTFERHCGSLSGINYAVFFENICNAGISEEKMSEAVVQTCVTLLVNPWTYV